LQENTLFLNISGSFSSAVEAFEKIQHKHIDVLLTDIDMPDLNGLDFRGQMMDIPVCIFIYGLPRLCCRKVLTPKPSISS
jgi:two-component system LytT family response regulator